MSRSSNGITFVLSFFFGLVLSLNVAILVFNLNSGNQNVFEIDAQTQYYFDSGRTTQQQHKVTIIGRSFFNEVFVTFNDTAISASVHCVTIKPSICDSL